MVQKQTRRVSMTFPKTAHRGSCAPGPFVCVRMGGCVSCFELWYACSSKRKEGRGTLCAGTRLQFKARESRHVKVGSGGISAVPRAFVSVSLSKLSQVSLNSHYTPPDYMHALLLALPTSCMLMYARTYLFSLSLMYMCMEASSGPNLAILIPP